MEENSVNGAAEVAHTSEIGQPRSRLEMEARQSVQGYIAIKGTRNGLLLTLEPETPFNELLDALARRLAEAPAFFRGAALSVDTSRRMLRISERVQLEDLLAYYQMSILPIEQVAVGHTVSVSQPEPKEARDLHEERGSRETRDLKEIRTTIVLPPLELSPDISTQTGEIDALRERDPRESDDTLFLRRTVRSGQAIHHHSTVVVLGDINPGAEIVSGGDVIVWGVLRGMVHAGYPDNETALVCALQLAPVQLRIAHLLSRPPEGFDVQPHPEVASIRQGQIIVEAWLNGRPPKK